MPESSREEVNTADAIRAILDSYPFGNGLLRELLQNSDDAGATSQVGAIFDALRNII
jgi:sacsin